MEIKPGPRINSINRPFWEGCNRSEMLLQQCESDQCKKWMYFPRVCCPHCGGGDLAWRTASGKGRIVTFTRIHRPHHKAFLADAPYYFIAVQLDEGQDPAPTEVLAGQRVEAFFLEQSPGQKLPFFRLC
jgi:uncharacterized OB-fold protein